MQFDNATGALFRRIYDAGIKRPRIDVQAHSTFPELFRIDHAMHGIRRIHRAGMRGIHFHGVGRYKLRRPVLDILRKKMKIFYF